MDKLGQYDSIPTSLHWDGKHNALYVACANGTLDVIRNMGKKIQHKANKETTKSMENCRKYPSKEANSEKTKPDKQSPPSTTSRRRVSFPDSDREDNGEISLVTFKPPESDTAPKSEAQDSTLSDSDDEIGGDQKRKAVATCKKKKDLPEKLSPNRKGDASDDEEDEEFKDDDNKFETQPPPHKVTTKDLDQNVFDKSLSRSSPTAATMDAMSKDTPPRSLTSVIDAMADSDDEDDSNSKSEKTGYMTQSKGENLVDEEEMPSSKTKSTQSAKRVLEPAEGEDIDDDEDVIFVEESSEKSTKEASAKNAFVEEEAEDDNEGDEEEEIANKKNNRTTRASEPYDDEMGAPHDHNNGFGNDSDVDDDDEDSMQDDIDKLQEKFGKAHGYSSASTRGYGSPTLAEPQAPFAPSSTPLNLPRRFLCWNHIGSVTLLRRDEIDTTRSTVDVNFTDSAFRRPISFTDNMGFILGSLGDDGGIFATDLAHDEDDDIDENDEDLAGLSLSEQTKAILKKSQKQRMRKGSATKRPTGSSIYFHRFETFGSLREKDWYLTLPDGERVLGCACGEGWAAVTTR